MLARRQALGARLGAQARALGVLALGRWAGRWARRAEAQVAGAGARGHDAGVSGRARRARQARRAEGKAQTRRR